MNRRPNQSRSSYDAFSPQGAVHLRMHSPDADFFAHRKRRPIRRTIFLALLGAIVLLLLVNLACNQFVFVKRVSVPIRGLSEAFEGYTILHISDLKGKRFGQKQGLFDFALGGEKYDLVLITGDMISPMGNAQPFFDLLERLKEINASAPMYYIEGDGDPLTLSMDYAPGGSPFAPWVLGAAQHGAQLLSSPVYVEKEGQRIWLTTRAQSSLDLDTMQGEYERQYLSALSSGDENAIEMTAYRLNTLEGMREAREKMTAEDIYIALTHALPDSDDEGALHFAATPRAVDLMIGGHYLGGLLRLPGVGAVFVPSSEEAYYGLFPEDEIYSGLVRRGPSWLYASSGLGAQDMMYPQGFFRLMNPPSVTLITLTPSAL